MKATAQDSGESLNYLAEDDSKDSYLVYRIADQFLASSLDGIGEIVEHAPISYFPSPYPFFKGLVNLRGKILGIVDLAGLLGHKHSKPLFEGVFITLNLPSGSIGVLVDEVKETVLAKPQPVDYEGGMAGDPIQAAELGYFKYEEIHVRAISLSKYIEERLSFYIEEQSA